MAHAFAAATVRNPYDLAAWVGLYQADPDRRTADEPALVLQVRAKNPAPTALFRLEALRYYRAQMQFDHPLKDPMLISSMVLLLRAWRLAHQPMAGLLLWENMMFVGPGVPGAPESSQFGGANEANLVPELEAVLMRPDAYRVYLRDKKFHLDADPPPAKMTPKQNCRMLCWLLWVFIPRLETGSFIWRPTNRIPIIMSTSTGKCRLRMRWCWVGGITESGSGS
ncbi:MAG: hypothetical protein KGJ62_01030 [Armatimonadetes bacterium]|nr:hypothetical protein [Armatimonadota bacterium]